MFFQRLLVSTTVCLLTAAPALSQIVAPTGYIYDAQLLASTTQNCVAPAPGGTFVAVGPGFTANAQSIVLAKESGELKLVASGFSSVADCAYDANSDTLYVTDNADNDDLGLMLLGGNTGAQTGDSVYAFPNAKSASGLLAFEHELLPADSVPFAASVAVDASGNVYVSDSAGGGLGTVTKIAPGPVATTFASGFDFTGGLAIDPISGDIFVAEFLDTFDNQVSRFDSAGTPVAPTPFAAPSFSFGSLDATFNTDGSLLTTGVFAGDVVSFDAGGAFTPFISGATFASGIAVNEQTGRVEMLSSTFSGADEDKSLHRFVPIDRLVPGTGSSSTECLHEFYGLELAPGSTKEVVCTDGAACDADGTVNDECSFPVGLCLNVDDSNFADCSAASSITSVELKAKPFNSSLSATVAAANGAAPVAGPTCFFSDGYIVPVKVTGSGKRDGKGKLKITALADDGRKDSDSAKLVCVPAP